MTSKALRNLSFALMLTALAAAAPLSKAFAQSNAPSDPPPPTVVTGTDPEPIDDVVNLSLLLWQVS